METFSMNVIAHTLSQHAEMIAPGVMGINFMKPEKPINTMSEVYKLVQEQEQNKVKSPTPPRGPVLSPTFTPTKVPPVVQPKPKPVPVVNASVPFAAPAPAPKAPAPAPKAPAPPPAAPPSEVQSQQGPCSDCGRSIVGQFVCLHDRTLHEECFKCSTCGTTLKNVGYHNINNKLYCDTHAVLAANVMAASSVPSAPSPAPAPTPVQAPVAPPKPLPTTAPTSFAPPPQAAPHVQQGPVPFHQNLVNFPLTPSSSGGLTFRSISPQPFKRISGDFHKVSAPSSPTPSSGPAAPLMYSSGPLPFEMKPYMPPDQSSLPLFSGVMESSEMSEISQSSQTSQTREVTQTIQRSSQVSQSMQKTTQVSHQSSQQNMSLDYRMVTGQSKTKFIWPPPKPLFEVEGSAPEASVTPTPQQNYSPLVTQSMPANVAPPQRSEAPPTFRSVQPPFPAQQQAPPSLDTPILPAPPSSYIVPPLPTTFPAEPVKIEENEIPPPAPAPAPVQQYVPPTPPEPQPIEPTPTPQAPPPSLASLASGFAPVLPPVVDMKAPQTPAQPGVPTGAGSKPAPKKGRGQLMNEQTPGRIAICADCGDPIRGPFIIALSRTWCPTHFHCNNLHCKTQLIDVGFVEEQGQLYCECCYEAFLAPICAKCNVRIKGDCLNALDKQWHPECFLCAYCHKPFGNNSFYLEDGLPYCEKDWNELFTTKCVGCGFPIEAGDRWVEALNNNYHSQCFKCSVCSKNLEGQSFYAKGGRPFCKAHAR